MKDVQLCTCTFLYNTVQVNPLKNCFSLSQQGARQIFSNKLEFDQQYHSVLNFTLHENLDSYRNQNSQKTNLDSSFCLETSTNQLNTNETLVQVN